MASGRIPYIDQTTSVNAIPSSGGRVEAPDEVGRFLVGVGKLASDTFAERDRIEERKRLVAERDDEERAKAQASVALAEMGTYLDAKEQEIRDKNTGDPTGYAGAVHKEIETAAAELLTKITHPKARLYAETHLATFGANRFGHAMTYERAQKDAYYGQQASNATAAYAGMVVKDPTLYPVSRDAMFDMVDNALSPPKREAMRDAIDRHLRQAAADGEIARTPGAVYSATNARLGVAPEVVEPGSAPAPVAPEPEPEPGPSAPRGERNRNPGNLRTGGGAWQGLTGEDADGFVQFDTPVSGIRALAKNLQSYDAKGLDTVAEVIGRWAPKGENDTAAYINVVAKSLGVKSDQRIDLSDRATMLALVTTIIRHENGRMGYSAATIEAGVDAALGKGTVPPVKVASATPATMTDAGTATYALQDAGPVEPTGKSGVPWVDALTPDELVKVHREARAAMERNNVHLKQSIETRERDAAAMAIDGKQSPPVPTAEYVAAYGAVDGARRAYEAQQVQVMASDVAAFKVLSAPQIDALLTASASVPGTGYAASEQRNEVRKRAAAAVMKARQEDWISAADAQGLAKVGPIDWSNPEAAQAELRNRTTVALMAEKYAPGVRASVLKRGEADSFREGWHRLPAMDRVRMMRSMKEGIGDPAVFDATVQQVAPDSRATVVMAALAAKGTPEAMVTAERITRGEELLNPSKQAKREDGKPGMFPMPKDFSTVLAEEVGAALLSRPSAMNDLDQAARAWYAARASDLGLWTKDTTDSNLVKQAVAAITGPVIGWGGGKVMLPYGMDRSVGHQRLSSAYANALHDEGLEGKAPSNVEQAKLIPQHEGTYTIAAGDGVLLSRRTGRPIILNINGAEPPGNQSAGKIR